MCLLVFIAGCNDDTSIERLNPVFQYEIYVIATTQGPATKKMFDIESRKDALVLIPPVFTGADIASLEVTKCEHGQSRIVVVPTATGLARLKATAASNKLSVSLNGVGLQRQFQFRADDTGRFTLSGHPNGLFHNSALPKVLDLP
jgi:hypothetical protein